MSTLLSNMEWCSHFANTQTQISTLTNPLLSVTFSAGESGLEKQLGTMGPFRINLDKNGNPQALFLTLVPSYVQNLASFTGSVVFKTTIRTINRKGSASSIEQLSTNTFTASAGPPTVPYYWVSLTGSNTFNQVNTLYSYTGSICQPYANIDAIYNLPVRTTQSLNTGISGSSDSSQAICYAFLDVSVRSISATGASFGTAGIVGLYLREVNPYEEY